MSNKNIMSGFVIQREIEMLKSYDLNISALMESDYEKNVEELLNLVVSIREARESMSKFDQLVEFMVENRVPRSAQAIDMDGLSRGRDLEAETRKNTAAKAREIMDIAGDDFATAMRIVRTMI